MGSLALQVSIILFFALAGYLVSSKINQSAVVGVILLGIIIGPSFLHIVEFTDAVKVLAHMGAILLLFSVGLEFRIRDVFKVGYFFIALCGLILPWIACYFTGLMFGYSFSESMFIGVAMAATSIAITAKVLEEMKKLNTDAARAIIGAAVIDDVLGLLALSAVIQTSRKEIAFLGMVMVTIKAVLFMAAGVLAGAPLKKALIRLDATEFCRRFPDFLFISSVMLCFLYASIAELTGLSAIVGAFLAGAVFDGMRFTHSKNLKEGAEYFHIVFGSIFFISLGILANLREVPAKMVPFLAVLLFVAVVSKLAGCGLSARLSGFSRPDSAVIGFGMAPRGEVAMMAALIGLTSGAIGQDIYVAVVLVSLMTTILSPIIIRNLRWK
jgi:Kef-type K+ transport system membrane component KefB